MNIDAVIQALGNDLKNPDHKRRLEQGIRFIAAMTVAGYNPRIANKVLIPVFTRGVYQQFRFDLPVKAFITATASLMAKDLVPHTNDDILVLKNGRHLPTRLIDDVDEEAEYMADLYNRVRGFINKVIPEE